MTNVVVFQTGWAIALIQRTVATRDAAIRVARRVVDVICLGLDNATRHHALGYTAHKHFASEETGERHGTDGHFCSIQSAQVR
jgi:hypothetical protein